MNRRTALAGALCAGAALAAQACRPHRYVSLLRSARLDDLAPRSFGPWTSQDVGDPLALNTPGTLSAELYDQIVTRDYSDAEGRSVLMLLAYGARQSDELQLHRPEVCYPAFGYALMSNEPASLELDAAVRLPARRLLAKSRSAEESVIYWTRLGEYMPNSAAAQRKARFESTLAGVVPDGILCRFSTEGASAAGWARLEQFVRGLVAATGPEGRRVLLGTVRSARLGRMQA